MDGLVCLGRCIVEMKGKRVTAYVVKGRAEPWLCGPRCWVNRKIHSEQEQGKWAAKFSSRSCLPFSFLHLIIPQQRRCNKSIRSQCQKIFSHIPHTFNSPPPGGHGEFSQLSFPSASSTPALFLFTPPNHTLWLTELGGDLLTEPWSSKEVGWLSHTKIIQPRLTFLGKKGLWGAKSHGPFILNFMIQN